MLGVLTPEILVHGNEKSGKIDFLSSRFPCFALLVVAVVLLKISLFADFINFLFCDKRGFLRIVWQRPFIFCLVVISLSAGSLPHHFHSSSVSVLIHHLSLNHL
ncbi:hypothetical protein OUZ56_030416 [Daphnia magna]|uniref:Uncharacterized protein n=1 Tax=Daphnia magna TaxID=35525 RepID=A0ABQ9ZR86_9CRUS|nr:hypothetical protein OUZ56_030416 [Daphnia magna]